MILRKIILLIPDTKMKFFNSTKISSSKMETIFSKHYRMFDFMKKITFQVEQKWFSGNKKFYFSYRLKNSQILYNLYSLMNHFLKKLLVTKRLKLMWKIILPILKKKWNFSIQRTFFFSGNGNYHFLLHYGMFDFTWNKIIISHSITKES